MKNNNKSEKDIKGEQAPIEFEAVFLPTDDAILFEERFDQGRFMVEEGKCVLLIPYRKSESGQDLM